MLPQEQKLEVLDNKTLYSVKELSEAVGMTEGSIRKKMFSYSPEHVMHKGIIHFTGAVAKEFLKHRKFGPKKK